MSDLKVGDKVKMLKGYLFNRSGQVLTLVKLEKDSVHLFEDYNGYYHIPRAYYEVLPKVETKQHLHADLILKYAMIAQYDDKPWEQFEFSINGDTWSPCSYMPTLYPHIMYRLKPQPPVVQVGQTWVSSGNNTGVTVINPDVRTASGNRHVMLEITLDPALNLKTTIVLTYEQFLNNFKRKE